jgi:hypothetical protein
MSSSENACPTRSLRFVPAIGFPLLGHAKGASSRLALGQPTAQTSSRRHHAPTSKCWITFCSSTHARDACLTSTRSLPFSHRHALHAGTLFDC